MSPYRRNVLVGITVIAGLCALGWMIIEFGGAAATPFAPQSFPVTFTSGRADGINDGSPIQYKGVEVGRVDSTELTKDNKAVYIHAKINFHPELPANVHGSIRTTSALGSGATVMLELNKDEEPTGKLSAGAQLAAAFEGGILPPEFGELAANLNKTVIQFNDSKIIAHADDRIQQLGKVIEDIQKYTADPKLQKNITDSLQNLQEATASAARLSSKLEAFTTQTSDNLNGISKQMNDRLEQVSKLMTDVQQISAKINNGDGTAGKLINDPKLYEALVDTTQNLNLTVKDLKRLAEQWEQEGVSLKLK